MNCGIEGCPGEYEASTIVHTVRHNGQVVVIDHVPADVCSLCGDALLLIALFSQLDTRALGRKAIGGSIWTTVDIPDVIYIMRPHDRLFWRKSLPNPCRQIRLYLRVEPLGFGLLLPFFPLLKSV